MPVDGPAIALVPPVIELASAAEAVPLPVHYGPARPNWQLATKRIFDMACAAALLVATFPLLVIIAAVVKLTSPGPVLYLSRREGRYGKIFSCIKFRTMDPNAERMQSQLEERNEATYPIFKIQADPRVTKVGTWLRATSFDELPQLFNVLIGQMSLVGPRPLPLRDCNLLTHADRRRHTVLPGMTGLWQVTPNRHRDGADIVALDLAYVDSWTVLGDFGILAQTALVVLRSLLGVEDGRLHD